jgi:lipoyl(octanoyl) transferase
MRFPAYRSVPSARIRNPPARRSCGAHPTPAREGARRPSPSRAFQGESGRPRLVRRCDLRFPFPDIATIFYDVLRTRDELILGLDRASLPSPVEWRLSDGLTPYEDALGVMEARAAAIAAGSAPELVWLLEHSPLYTAGTSAKPQELLHPRFPVHWTGRGGQFTYHGPGQRVAYVMLDLKKRGPDVRRFVAGLEEWIIRALAAFNVAGERREDRIGVWVRRSDKGAGREDKIAAIGIRLKRWVSLHGIALNVHPDLSHFAGIVPCGIAEPRYGVTSLMDLGLPVTMADVDIALRRAFESVFGHVVGSTENKSPGRRSARSPEPPSR